MPQNMPRGELCLAVVLSVRTPAAHSAALIDSPSYAVRGRPSKVTWIGSPLRTTPFKRRSPSSGDTVNYRIDIAFAKPLDAKFVPGKMWLAFGYVFGG